MVNINTVIERKVPRISVNKLGEYMSAAVIRRRQIVVQQKRPQPIITSYYREAQRAIVAYITSSNLDDSTIGSEIDDLTSRLSTVADNNNELQRLQSGIEMLESFMEISDLPDLSGYSLEVGENDPPKMLIADVEVSVRPDVILRLMENGKSQAIGAIKLHFPKSYSLNDESGPYVATTVHQYMDQFFEDENCDYRMCYVIDVYSQRVFSAPRSFKRRRTHVEAACAEIKRAWDSY